MKTRGAFSALMMISMLFCQVAAWTGRAEALAPCDITSTSCPCTPGYTLCQDGVCCGLTSDVDNCGACGNVCPAGPPDSVRTCTNGVCGFVCRYGYTLCGDRCVDLTSDPMTCGRCCGSRWCFGLAHLLCGGLVRVP